MAFEVACSQCQGRLMVEEAGVIVACPHCGAHLNIEAPVGPAATDESTSDSGGESAADSTEQTSEASAPTDESLQPPADQQTTETTETTVSEAESEPAPADGTPAAFPSFNSAPETRIETTPLEAVPSITENLGEPATNVSETSADTASEDTPSVNDPADAQPPSEPESAQPPSEPESAQPAPAEIADSPETASIQSSTAASAYAGRGVSRHTFTLVRNYAIAMTIAVLFLVYKLLNPNMSALESLPDVKPQKKDDKIVYKLVPEATEMPPGHQLVLGQSQRFGNLQVTPVRITKDPVEFVHHLGETGVTKEPGPDVVKLWFEFENLSTDQHIAPLDGLVFKRDDNDFENVRSNNFACRLSEKKKGGKLAFVYDLNEFDIWNLRDQHVEKEIAPGEKLTTYIPTTEEGVTELLNSDEPLIWRVHFRKGYSPKNYGVTTVIEVAFKSSDIRASTVTQPADEPASAPNA